MAARLPDELIRRPSLFSVLSTDAKKLDIRAHQRTYQGLYVRTTIGTLSFAILVLKLFSKEFLKIGLLYTIYGMMIFIISLVRLQNMDLYYLKEIREFSSALDSASREEGNANGNGDDHVVYFKTSGNFILFITLVSLVCYGLLFYLIYKL